MREKVVKKLLENCCTNIISLKRKGVTQGLEIKTGFDAQYRLHCQTT